MNTGTMTEALLELVQETSMELIKIHFDLSDRKTRLLFPRKKKGDIRISEQELRFTFSNILNQSPYPRFQYSVETPTLQDYCFSNGKSKSASSDLSLYLDNNKVLNIEFKAHNPSQPTIDKDIEKLCREDCNGAWIHIFKNENKRTVETLFNKFEQAFNNQNLSIKPISFHILILETKTLLTRKGKDSENDYTNNIFNIDYSLWRNQPPGRYQYCNGKLINDATQEIDWQIDIY